MKTCKRCNETKPLDCFTENKAAKDGLEYRCRQCRTEYDAQRYEDKREQILKQNAEYRQTEKGKVTRTKASAKYCTKIPPGVYQVINKQTGCRYIGESEIPNKRKANHWSYLRGGNHRNKPLQQAYNKFGEDAFVFEMIEYCEPSQLKKREAYWIKKYKDCCYNNK